jgi:putative endonuclease
VNRSRQEAHSHGHRAEQIALWYLRLKGYRLLVRRYKTPVGEIDLIMRNRDTTIFVEVKARQTVDQGLFAVTTFQSRRISQAAAWYIARHQKTATALQRFDIISVPSYLWPTHIKNAFDGIL